MSTPAEPIDPNPPSVSDAEFLHMFLRACSESMDDWINQNGVEWARKRLLEVTNAMLGSQNEGTGVNDTAQPLADQNVTTAAALITICPSTCQNCQDKLRSGVYTFAQFMQCMNCPCTN